VLVKNITNQLETEEEEEEMKESMEKGNPDVG
jgi:hypothetical protein